MKFKASRAFCFLVVMWTGASACGADYYRNDIFISNAGFEVILKRALKRLETSPAYWLGLKKDVPDSEALLNTPIEVSNFFTTGQLRGTSKVQVSTPGFFVKELELGETQVT